MKTQTFDILEVVKMRSIGIAILISYQSESRYHVDIHSTRQLGSVALPAELLLCMCCHSEHQIISEILT